MTFPQAIQSGFANYLNYRGRALRSEFWWWQLFTLLVAFAAGILDTAFNLNANIFSDLGALATLLPSISVAVRRLHDVDMSGWWLLVFFVPFVGVVLLIAWFIGEGTIGYNRFGANLRPKEVSLHAQGRSLHRGQTNTAS